MNPREAHGLPCRATFHPMPERMKVPSEFTCPVRQYATLRRLRMSSIIRSAVTPAVTPCGSLRLTPPRQPFFSLPFPLAAAKVRDARCGEAGDITLKPQTHVLREMQHAAPPKPALGAPCTGCGACCLLEPCPVGRLWLGSWRGRCRALEWDGAAHRYVCGMVRQPARYLRWLPARLNAWAGRRFARWIAAGSGCDADIEVTD